MDLEDKLRQIKLIVLDVDGVLTSGAITYGNPDIELKSFSTKDGFGITLGKQAGLKFGILTARVSQAVARRAKELKFDYYESGQFHKLDALLQMIDKAQLAKDEVMYIGDDILDLVCKPKVGVFACPKDAVARVKAESDLVLECNGGNGAVRLAIDMLLEAQGLLQQTEDYFIKDKLL